MSTWPGRAKSSSPSEDGRSPSTTASHCSAVRQRERRRPVAHLAGARTPRPPRPRLRLPGTQVVPGDAHPGGDEAPGHGRRRRATSPTLRPAMFPLTPAPPAARSARQAHRSPTRPHRPSTVDTTDDPPASTDTVPRRHVGGLVGQQETRLTHLVRRPGPGARARSAARRTMSARPAGVNSAVGTRHPRATALTRMPAARRTSPRRAAGRARRAWTSGKRSGRRCRAATRSTRRAPRCWWRLGGAVAADAPRSPRKIPRTFTAMTRFQFRGGTGGRAASRGLRSGDENR